MLRGIVICPDLDLNERLGAAIGETGLVTLTRVLDRYAGTQELVRILRAHAPQVVFLGTESMAKATETVREIEKTTPGVQIIAVGRSVDPHLLLELMRTGIREYTAFPFERIALTEALLRIRQALDARPVQAETTDHVFSFLPSKCGVGTSTVALNAAVALSRMPDTNVLLSDFDLNSGMVRFMLKLDNPHSVIDAAENSTRMDESLWPAMVTPIENLDVLHAGKLQPDFRIEPTQIAHLMEFMRRNYKALCFDLSGNLEKYSLEIMHESKRIYLVCTPEIPSVYLAREKYFYLKQLDLHERVYVILNRCQKRPLLTPDQVEELLGMPIAMTFHNDYQTVYRALQAGRWVEPSSQLGKQFAQLADQMIENRPIQITDRRKHFIEYFSIVPGRYTLEAKKPAV